MTQHNICIDFEGEGKKPSGELPLPHLLGALLPAEGGTKQYHLFLLREELEPMTRSGRLVGKVENRKVCSLHEAIEELLGKAAELDCRLVGYSQHEQEVVEHHLAGSHPATFKAFEARWYNVKPKAQALAKRRGQVLETKTLNDLLKALLPDYERPKKPSCGAAEACRRLVKAGARSSRWRQWEERHKELAEELVRYNKQDCTAVWKLLNRVVANYPLPEPSGR